MFVVAAVAAASNSIAFFVNASRLPDNPMWWSLVATLQLSLAFYMCVIARRAWHSFKRARLIALMNVRIVRADEVLKCRVVYLGVQDDLDTFVVVEPVAQAGDALLCDVVPPRTQLIGMGEL